MQEQGANGNIGADAAIRETSEGAAVARALERSGLGSGGAAEGSDGRATWCRHPGTARKRDENKLCTEKGV
jgi:hypothetical protein